MIILPEPPLPPPLPPIKQIEDEAEDTPLPGKSLGTIGPFQLPEIIYGAGAFSSQYNSDAHIGSVAPLRSLRLALRYGIRAIDTSPYYGPSEIVLGNALKLLEKEFPRSSYKLMTKCGRYGVEQSSFDYSPSTIRASVQRSLARMRTDYLDIVYLHDVEFVCTPVTPRQTGNHLSSLTNQQLDYGLDETQRAKVWGEGDQKILDAVAELRKMKEEGLIRNVGITGYPLPTLLRLALLVLYTTPFQPLDIVLSYSHLTLQNVTFLNFLPYFYNDAKVNQVITASPLSMGLLTSRPPAWNPAPEDLRLAVSDSCQVTQGWAGGLPNIALGYTIDQLGKGASGVPLAVGFSLTKEVHECMKVWREIQEGKDENIRRMYEKQITDIFERSGYLDWSWASP